MRIYEVQEKDGLVVARRTRKVPEGTGAADGWKSVSAATFETLSERKAGMLARIDGAKVAWEHACARPIEIEKGALVTKAEARAHEVMSKGKMLQILARLVAHAVTLGIMADPKSTDEEKDKALVKERILREWLEEVESELVGLQDKLATVVAAIAAADSPEKIKDINLRSSITE